MKPTSWTFILDLILQSGRNRSGTVTVDKSMTYTAPERSRPLKMRLRC